MSRTYDHGDPCSQSLIVGEDQPHQGSGPVYTDPYGPIPDVQSQSRYATSETRYNAQYGTQSTGAQQGYVKAPPYRAFPSSGYRYANSSSSSSQRAMPAHQSQPVYTGKHVETAPYKNSGAKHSLPLHPTTIDARRITPPSAEMLSNYYFLSYCSHERDAVYSLNAHLKPNQDYPKNIVFARTDRPSVGASAKYNQATHRPAEYYERRTR
ncbi:hypothetical protein EAF00_008971 [Botryotinia globosa]|nr:hypothetical protein EAF00_008971 [Botryotinia globosa]